MTLPISTFPFATGRAARLVAMSLDEADVAAVAVCSDGHVLRDSVTCLCGSKIIAEFTRDNLVDAADAERSIIRDWTEWSLRA